MIKIYDDYISVHVSQSVIYMFCLMASCLNKPCVFDLGKHNAANSFYCHLSNLVFPTEATEGVLYIIMWRSVLFFSQGPPTVLQQETVPDSRAGV